MYFFYLFLTTSYYNNFTSVIIALIQVCWAVPVPKKDRKTNEVIVMEPWSKHLTRLSEESKHLQNNIVSTFGLCAFVFLQKQLLKATDLELLVSKTL